MGFDVVVVGAGGMGSAAADALAGRGQRVLALEQFDLGHSRGSSHGRTRIVRQAYFESPAYIPLLRRAYALWDSFPAECSLHRVGCLMLGDAGSPVITGALRSAATWDVAVEALASAEVRRRFPAFAPGSDTVAVLEPDAGYVRPEETVAFLLGRARERGAVVRSAERVLGWDSTVDGIRVHSTGGVVEARRLVLTAGAWTPGLAGALGLPIRVERRVMHFFEPADPALYAAAVMPTFIWDLGAGDAFYGFPRDGADGVKVAFHARGPLTDPEQPQPAGSAEEVQAMRAVLAGRLPGLAGRHLRSVGCMYALTPDHDFVLGPAPGAEDRVLVAAGFSGHGFKFVPVVGEILADLVLEGGTSFDLEFLSPERFLSR